MAGHTSPLPSAASAMVVHIAGLTPVVHKQKKKKAPRKPRRWLRTRDREHLRFLNVQLDINSLHSEIQALELHRTLLTARTLTRRDTPDGSYVRMVREYFAQLRYGYADPGQHPQMVTAHSFLNAMLDADVAKGHLRGIALCIKMIAMYTAAFGPVIHELVSASVHVNPNADADEKLTPGESRTVLVRARTRYQTTIVPATFAIIFPHAPQAMRAYLYGQPLDGYGQFDIVFDTVLNRVVRFDMEFDFLPAFSKVLPRPQDLAVLFSGAKVATDCCIGDEAAGTTRVEVESVDATTTDEDTASDHWSSGESSPVVTGRASASAPSRSMAIQSILNDADDDDEYSQMDDTTATY